ncbi:hypothetical protein NLJ89_g1007 [Agrocybe chaxingu]|uniref:Protein kinase domain-containing protein n=1 Tax=Agrocybe chaxingu TaxID=84603 RepID=A0A9W8TE68_9AGAR|nr:hypothetical protein NLJ89_g1007 [Agrocybe chaxingu]
MSSTHYLRRSDSSSRPKAPSTRRYSHSDDSPPSSPTSSEDSSADDDEVNRRIQPFWPKYQLLFKARGYHLDTVKDVKNFYSRQIQQPPCDPFCRVPYFSSPEEFQKDDALCPDAGLPDNLFRGLRISDGLRIVVKAVHAQSREFVVISTLTRPPLRDDPMNHTIPVLDLFKFPADSVAFIVMEEWSSQLVPSSGPCCLKGLLSALRQCLEVKERFIVVIHQSLSFAQHAAFLHKHHIAHLDIALQNLVTDFKGHYAYIDYEISRHFSPTTLCPVIHGYHATEMPPECEKGAGIDPYKVDVWALGVLMLRACKVCASYLPMS